MKIQILSDLHLEHGGEVPEHHPDADVIVLAGDLAPYTEGLVDQLAEDWSSAPHIFYVLGNHEFYGTEIDETRARLAKECAGAGIHLLDPRMVQIDGTRFIGATLWTDLLLEGKADEIGAHMRVSREISDFRGAIQLPGARLQHRRERGAAPCGPSLHRARAGWRRNAQGDRAVVITHHAPSPRSIRDWYKGDPFNCAFASDLGRVIERYQPALWIHGHMHDPVDKRLGRTRLVANPAGYAYEGKKGFDPAFCLDLDATLPCGT